MARSPDLATWPTEGLQPQADLRSRRRRGLETRRTANLKSGSYFRPVPKDEEGLTDKARQIGDLKKHLASFWPPHELNGIEKDRFISALTTIIGHAELKQSHHEESEKGFDLELLEAHTTAWGTANRQSWDKLDEQYHEQACRLAGLRDRLKDLYLLVDPPADPGAVRDPRVQPAPETSLAHDALAPLVQEKHRVSSAPAQRARRLVQNRAGEWRDGKQGTPLASADLALVEEGLPWIRSPEEHERRLIQASREAEKRRVDQERWRKRLRNGLVIAVGIVSVVASVFAVIARLGWVKANEQAGIANEQAGIAKRQARIARLRLQHNVLSQVDALALTDPVRAQDLLQDAVLFPDEDRDFAWGFQYGRCLWVRTLAAHRRAVNSVAFSSDGRTLATGGSDGNLRFWDAASREPRGEPIQAHQDTVNSVAFSSDGRTLATGDIYGNLRFWDAASREPRGEPIQTHQGTVMSVAFSSDGRTLATGSYDGYLRFWDAASREPRGEPILAHQGAVNSVAFSSDGRTLATGGIDSNLRFWDAATREPRGEPIKAHQGTVNSVAFSSDGRTLATGSSDGNLRFWDAASREPRGEPIQAHQGKVNSVAFSSDGRTLATGGSDGNLRFWDAASREPRGEPIQAHQGKVNSVAFSSDGRTLATGNIHGHLRFWFAKFPEGDMRSGSRDQKANR